MRTLALRMTAHCENAAVLAAELERHPRVERVYYPGLEGHPDRELAQRQMNGFGGMVSFTVAGGAEAAVTVHDRLKLFSRAGSLGSVQSLVSIPARMSHRHLDEEMRKEIKLPSNLVRLSVGLESSRDLLADLEQALA